MDPVTEAMPVFEGAPPDQMNERLLLKAKPTTVDDRYIYIFFFLPFKIEWNIKQIEVQHFELNLVAMHYIVFIDPTYCVAFEFEYRLANVWLSIIKS